MGLFVLKKISNNALRAPVPFDSNDPFQSPPGENHCEHLMFSFPKCFLSSSIHFYFILTISLRYNRHTVFKVYSLIGSDMKLI